MFEREHHRQVARVLHSLDAELLARHQCLFGGGTAMTLRYGEYRESVDIDFLMSSLPGYRTIRQMLTGADGLDAITRPGQALTAVRDVRADQYGLRTVVRMDDTLIKLEIIHEARITLALPGPKDVVCGVATLAPLDMAACKLLANADRWADGAVHSRDLIDLAMMQATRPLLSAALAKAEQAYGNDVRKALFSAIDALRQQPQRLEACLRALDIHLPRAVVWGRIRRLVGVAGPA